MNVIVSWKDMSEIRWDFLSDFMYHFSNKNFFTVEKRNPDTNPYRKGLCLKFLTVYTVKWLFADKVDKVILRNVMIVCIHQMIMLSTRKWANVNGIRNELWWWWLYHKVPSKKFYPETGNNPFLGIHLEHSARGNVFKKFSFDSIDVPRGEWFMSFVSIQLLRCKQFF